ncbi:MAG: hypothetical protein LW630_09850 [Saprospiraceae bacterium]|nr:hypothetical protein [Saprospiraceae bacterium]
MPEIIQSPEVAIHEEIRNQLKTWITSEGQVIVHCLCKAGNEGMWLRIWPTTYLLDCHSPHRSELLFHENITAYPHWTTVLPHHQHQFTLIFSALPSDCILFDLKEIIPQSNGFEFVSIPRNQTDVYLLHM